ncbi:probable anion transporter 3, chloroplastic isoform X1 [Mangifera indica]|uniref:probable anion transporter 3, chloroplastic isoform X1 n=1 Tax=Mangifera indica TaxID=29780 RepID=UPI001CFC0493|nr:probable anion transporter 3, chloroplastic isoform X1 [Mangifera indica]
MAAKSLLHSSFSPKPSCFFNSESKSTKFRTSQLGFKPRNLKAEDDVKWGENISFSMISRVIKTKKKQQKGGMVVKCTAEGIERSLLKIGGRGETKVLIAERYKVVALLACVMCLCNADRVVMSVAIVPLAAKYGWSSAFLGIVQSSFLWGYIFSSVVGGVLVDKYGGRRVLACGVVLWSLSTLLTPWAANHSTLALLAARAFFGLAEGVALPAMTTLSSRWFPSHERASAVGISMAGFHLGNVVGLVLTPVMLATTGITGPFFLFSSIGLLWMTTWSSVATDDPRESPFISKSELRLIQAGKADSIEKKGNFPSLRLLLSKMPTWAIIVANITNNWGYFVLLTWMPIYFKTVFNVNLKQAAWFSAVPWGTMAVCGYIAGKASDSLIKAGHPITSVRKIMQSIGFIGPGLSLLCLNFAKSPAVAAALITAALSFSSFSQAGFLLNMQEIAPDSAGFLHGISNSAGTLAAIVSTIGTGYFVQWLGSFQAFLAVTAGLYFAATVFWNLYASGERVF